MADLEQLVPMGTMESEERALARNYHDTMCVAGDVCSAGSGLVGFEIERLPWLLPPTGRILHVRTVTNALDEVSSQIAELTTLAANPKDRDYFAQLRRSFPLLRVTRPGRMQCPKLDGPVDLRNLGGEVL
jgi:uncharacterized Fe-S cluster protein YjdI